MAYTIDFTATSDPTAAIPLYWTDHTETKVVSAAHDVWDWETGTYITVPEQTTDVTYYGLNRIYSSIAEFSSIVNYATISNNVVMRPDTSTATSSVIITSVGGTRFITTKEVEGFSITLSVPGLYYINKNTGYEATSVSVGIFYRAYNPASPPTNSTPWNILYTDYVISGKQRADILKTIKHSESSTPLPLSKYEILVVRNTTDHTGSMDYADDIYIKDVTEILYHSLSYNHTALLGVKIRATDQLSGQLPTVTAVVKGVKVSVPSNLVDAYNVRYSGVQGYNTAAIDAAYATQWDGQLGTTKVWTDNPVWCLYDLLTNKRYGLADYYKISPSKKGLMLANFYLMAKYCDEAVSYVDDSGAVPVTKYRPRFAINIVLDQAKTASEWVSQFAAIMRAVVFYSEGIFWIDIDRPKNITQLFNMSNIKDYSQSCTSYKGIPNSYEVQWVNPLINYEIDTFKLDAKELQTDATIEERKKALQLVGVTSFDQAKALAKYALLAGQNRTKLISFKTGTDGLRSFVSDVIGVQHDVPQWGFGGEVVSYDPSTLQVTVSTPITLNTDDEWFIKVAQNIDDIHTYGLSVSASGEFTTISLAATPILPLAAGDKFIVGTVTNQVSQFKIVSIKPDADGLCEISAVEYDAAMFEFCDDTSDLGTYNTGNHSLITNPQRSSVQGVHASTKLYQDSLGVWKTGVEVFYEAPQSSFWSSAKLHYSIAGMGLYTSLEANNTGYFFIPSLADGDYQFVVTSVFTSGSQTISDALSDGDRHPWTVLTVDAYAPNDEFMTGVTGLAIENMANDGTFVGRDCIVVWRRPGALDMSISAGEESTGAGTIGATNWFSHYEIVVTSLEGNIRRTDRVYNERYTYTHEQNIQDGVTRAFSVTVYAYDRLGRKSEGKSIECVNPAPLAISVD